MSAAAVDDGFETREGFREKIELYAIGSDPRVVVNCVAISSPY